MQVVLNTQIDPQGEFLSIPFVDTLRELTSDIMHSIRDIDEMPIERKDLWKW